MDKPSLVFIGLFIFGILIYLTNRKKEKEIDEGIKTTIEMASNAEYSPPDTEEVLNEQQAQQKERAERFEQWKADTKAMERQDQETYGRYYTKPYSWPEFLALLQRIGKCEAMVRIEYSDILLGPYDYRIAIEEFDSMFDVLSFFEKVLSENKPPLSCGGKVIFAEIPFDKIVYRDNGKICIDQFIARGRPTLVMIGYRLIIREL